MPSLDDLEVIGTATVTIEFFEFLKENKFKEPIVFVGVNDENLFCYMIGNGEIIVLDKKIEGE